MKNFIAYYRVSTQEQGKSGLGLTSQRDSIHAYVNSIGGEVVEEYTDIESGKNNDRKNLWAAMKHAKNIGATLVVKKFDRLSRGGLRIMAQLEEWKIPFIECDSPHDSTLLKEIKFSIAKDEVSKISERTKSALSVIKEKVSRGETHISKSGRVVTHLGNPGNLSPAAREKAALARLEKARGNENNRRAYAFIKALMDNGQTHTWRKWAQLLNGSGFVTSNGGLFRDNQVKRLMELYEEI